MAITEAIVTKIATIILSDEKGWKGVAWVVFGIFSPIIVAVILIFSTLGVVSEQNQTLFDLCLQGEVITDSVPEEYIEVIEKMQSAFLVIDLAISEINEIGENASGLDSVEVKSIFYSLYFEADELPSDAEIRDFVDSFVN